MPEDFRKFPGVFDDILDRSDKKPGIERAYWRERKLSQASEINEQFSIQDAKRTRVGNLIAHDGDRIEGCDIVTTNYATGTYDLAAGKVFLRGDVRSIDAAQLTGVSTTGDVTIGVRITEEVVDHEDDPDYLGQYPGAASAGEAGAIRIKYILSWGWSGDGLEGDLYAVYALRDGYVVDQAPPSELSGIIQTIADYDFGAHENYIDEGCHVTALGKTGGSQVFSIAEGRANILGFKRYRRSSTRYSEVEAPDIETVDAELHYQEVSGGSAVIELNHAPINGVSQAIIEKEFTETISRGGVANTADALSQTSVTEIVSVIQGETEFDETDDWLLDDDTIDWSPGGAEPAGASSYDVTYRYLDAVTPSEITDTTVTVDGGVDGGQAILTYSFKLPRFDRVCLDQTGNVVYLKGVSAREQPRAPIVPTALLSLAEVRNDWFGTPAIVNNGTRNVPFHQIWRMWNRLVDLLDLTALNRLRLDISAREPTAKHAVFVDPFTSDRYRDAGETQTAAVFDGTCQLAIDPTFETLSLAKPAMLDFTSEVVVRQELATDCMKINPYQVFAPLALSVTISPSEDFWEEVTVHEADPITIEEVSTNTRVFWRWGRRRWFNQRNDGQEFDDWTWWRTTTTETSSSEIIEQVTQRNAAFLRQISIAFTIGSMGNGEDLSVLTFDGVDVNPGSLSANASGVVTGSFDIPANVAAGVKEVYAEGASGSSGTARFEGRGIITEIVRQEIITQTRETRRVDPLAQTFAISEGRHVSGIDLRFCNIGDRSKPVIVEIVEVENGIPTQTLIAQTEVDMNEVVANTWHSVGFQIPPYIPADTEYAFVLKTDDADHSVSIARRGDFDAANQRWVGAQPYTVGVLLSSSNASTWTPHQDVDLSMRIRCAVFSPEAKTVLLGTIAVENMSDLICAANVNVATEATTMRFKVTPDDPEEDAQILENGQNWERTTFFDGDVKVEAVLTGTSKLSPILGRDTLVMIGSTRTEGVYISRGFEMGTDVDQDIRLKTRIPAGATLTVEVDKADDDWQEMTLQEAEALADGSQDRLYRKSSWTTDIGRIRIHMTGGPAARPVLGDLRSYSL